MTTKQKVIGIDIGGSKIKMVLWDGQKVLKTWQAQPATLANLKNGLQIFSSHNSQGLVDFKIGIGAPGQVEYKTNKTLHSANLKWLNGFAWQKFCKGIRVDNDAKCFLRSQTGFIKPEKRGNVLSVIFGTGIGGAVSGYRGKDGWAGEFGHMIINKGATWEKLYQATKDKPKEQEKINAIGLANLINIFNPEIIILGGKGAKMPNKKIISKYVLLPQKMMPKFLMAKWGDNAVAIGAAILWF